jgi:hypothetical protein
MHIFDNKFNILLSHLLFRKIYSWFVILFKKKRFRELLVAAISAYEIFNYFYHSKEQIQRNEKSHLPGRHEYQP